MSDIESDEDGVHILEPESFTLDAISIPSVKAILHNWIRIWRDGDIGRTILAYEAALAIAREEALEECKKIAERLQVQYERDDKDDVNSPYPQAQYLSGYWRGANAAKEISNAIGSLSHTQQTTQKEKQP